MMVKEDKSSVRLKVVYGLVLAGFVGVFCRAVWLQVVQGKSLEARALTQHVKIVNVPLKRGDIFDRHMTELAVSIDVDSVYVRPGEVDNAAAATKKVSSALDVEKADVKRGIKSGKKFVWLRRQVDLNEDNREILTAIDGIGIVKEGRRFYPHGHLAANLVGFAGLDSNGLEGVERRYDEQLKGTPIKIKAEKDATGKLLLFKDIDNAAQGKDLVLTIDKNIQYIAEKALKNAVDKYSAKGGTAIVMDPFSGEILAMATLPTFDPNEFSSYGKEAWRNRAVTDVYEPGSTMKAFLLAAALEEGVVKPNDSIYCENGKYKVYDRTFHDKNKYKWLSVAGVIKNSSNIGAIKIGNKLGKKEYYRYLKAFGFGEKTNIDLNGEQSGDIGAFKNWSDIKFNTISFGQGVSSTSIQLVTAMSALANGGFLMKPYVVKGIVGGDGKPERAFNPAIVRRVVSGDTARRSTEVLKGVTSKGGTGELAVFAPEFSVAGKTGTSQKPDHKNGGYLKEKYVVSFVGFVPADKPVLTILVTVDEPKNNMYGGIVAAPAFREIAKETLSYLGVVPESMAPRPNVSMASGKYQVAPASLVKSESGKKEARKAVYAEGVVPDFEGKTIREALVMAREASIDINVVGNGRAVSQSVTSGTRASEDEYVTVEFK